MKHFKQHFESQTQHDAYGAYILPKETIVEALTTLKNEDGYRFLVDITAIDYLTC